MTPTSSTPRFYRLPRRSLTAGFLLSAVMYYFAKEIHAQSGSTVGIILSAAGGTPIQSWIPEQVQRSDANLEGFFSLRDSIYAGLDMKALESEYEEALQHWNEQGRQGKRPLNRPQAVAKRMDIGGLYSSMLAPLKNYALRGIIWYQGEANANDRRGFANYYEYQLPLLVEELRKQMGRPGLPCMGCESGGYTL